MYRELLHIWGPFSINSFGLFVALGLFAITFLLYRNPIRKKIATDDQLYNSMFVVLLGALIGGRLLFVYEAWSSFEHLHEIFYIWSGGLSVLGCTVGALASGILYLRYEHIPTGIALDLFGQYAPLLHAIARIGCFFAGCCYGIATTLPWGIRYADAHSFAPLCTKLHPTQLYSSLCFLIIFLILNFYASCKRKPGQLFTLYLILASAERFIIDFWRADRDFTSINAKLSLHQILALILGLCACAAFIIVTLRPKGGHESV